MENHYVYSNKNFTCQKCSNFQTKLSIKLDFKRCVLLKKNEYELNDGDCPLSFEEFKEHYIGYSDYYVDYRDDDYDYDDDDDDDF